MFFLSRWVYPYTHFSRVSRVAGWQMANDISNAGCLLRTCWTWGSKQNNSLIPMWTCLVTRSTDSRHWSNILGNTTRTNNPGNSISRRPRYRILLILHPCRRSSRRLGRVTRWRKVRLVTVGFFGPLHVLGCVLRGGSSCLRHQLFMSVRI